MLLIKYRSFSGYFVHVINGVCIQRLICQISFRRFFRTFARGLWEHVLSALWKHVLSVFSAYVLSSEGHRENKPMGFPICLHNVSGPTLRGNGGEQTFACLMLVVLHSGGMGVNKPLTSCAESNPMLVP